MAFVTILALCLGVLQKIFINEPQNHKIGKIAKFANFGEFGLLSNSYKRKAQFF